jgi:hypothetical protein
LLLALAAHRRDSARSHRMVGCAPGDGAPAGEHRPAPRPDGAPFRVGRSARPSRRTDPKVVSLHTVPAITRFSRFRG